MLIMFMVSSWGVTGFIAFQNNHIPNTDDPLALFDKIYDKPWTRLGPYLVGMSVGWFLFKTNCKIRMSRVSTLVRPRAKPFLNRHFSVLADDCDCRLAELQRVPALADLRLVRRPADRDHGGRVQLAEPLGVGAESRVDRRRLLDRLRRIREHDPLRADHLPVLPRHLLRLSRPSDRHPLHGAQLRLAAPLGLRFNGKRSQNAATEKVSTLTASSLSRL